MSAANPGLYVHVPFCSRKCAYCSFCSIPVDNGRPEDYIESIAAEAEMIAESDALGGRDFATAYIGGGTPSALPEDLFARLMDVILGAFDFIDAPEVTIEANPESLNRTVISAVAANPAGRLSLGAQSFSGDVLRVLGRGHEPQAVKRAVEAARDGGVRSISLDLIYGAPGETPDSWRDTVMSAISLAPEHISCYCLSVEEGTGLERSVATGDLEVTGDRDLEEMYGIAGAELSRAGYIHYEISNFAKPGSESRHNLNYWRRGEYVGLGPSAHSHVGGVRWGNLPDVKEYCSRPASRVGAAAWREEISVSQAIEERVMLALRTADGLDLRDIGVIGGDDAEEALAGAARPLVEEKVLALHGRTITIPHERWFVSDEIIARLLGAAELPCDEAWCVDTAADHKIRSTKHLR